MAAEIVQRSPIANGEPTPDDKQLEHKDIEELFCLAQQKGFTQNGEMFSAEDLAELAQSFYGLSSSVTSRGLEDVRHVLSHLAEGNPVLVPYDAAKNHEPCIAQGHRAHWAVLTGFLCKIEDDGFEWSTVEEDLEQPLLYHSYCGVSLPNSLDRDHIYFLAKQGKSRHCGVWPSEALCESNLNLVEFDPLKKTEDFTLPVGGIEEGLCGKIILITLSNL